MGHIELARWADRILIAPATADLMARLAQGHADDLLTTLCLASHAEKFMAPAMNQAMWGHPATARNARQLTEDGWRLLGPDSGDQACGDVGPGRMLEPEAIMAGLSGAVERPAEGLKVVITAGPTREALDPVRYLSNHSSGKMGYALATAAAALGAEVHLISGPVALSTPPAWPGTMWKAPTTCWRPPNASPTIATCSSAVPPWPTIAPSASRAQAQEA